MKKIYQLVLTAVFIMLLPLQALAADTAASEQTNSAALDTDAENKISIELKGIDIVEALKIIAAKGKFNIVIGEGIQGRVTMMLSDVDIQDAFEIMLLSNHLAYDKRGDIIHIISEKEYERLYGDSFGTKKEVKTMAVKHARALEIAKSLEQAKSSIGKIIVDDASNTLVLIDNPSSIHYMTDIVQKLDQPAQTRVFQLKYAVAADIQTKISSLLNKGTGSIQVDPRTNKVAITDTQAKLDEIEAVIKAFDERQQQVLIEAKIVQVTLTDTYKLGVDWGQVFRQFHNFEYKTSFALGAKGAIAPGAEAVIGSMGVSDYAMIIQALKTIGDTNLLSSPRITAMNNQEAKILVGESRPYATNTVVTPATGPTTTSSQLSFLDIGIKLYVTPTINKDGFVTLKIKPEVSDRSSTDYEYGSPTTKVPIVQTTQAETTVTVKSGNTIIIAGLIKDSRTGSQNKVPSVGDIPIVGMMFKKTDNQILKQELVIFITTHIISGEENYLELPKTPPVDEGLFSVPEGAAFERRGRQPMDPGTFKESGRLHYDSDSEYRTVTNRIITPGTLEEYYLIIKDRILRNIGILPDGEIHRGKIKVSFRLDRKGVLVSEPVVQSTSNKALVRLAMDAVAKSSPFPSFPESIKNKEKDFLIDFSFE